KSTILSREIQTVVCLILPGELLKHAISEGTRVCYHVLWHRCQVNRPLSLLFVYYSNYTTVFCYFICLDKPKNLLAVELTFPNMIQIFILLLRSIFFLIKYIIERIFCFCFCF
ncbi:hypothetical protein EDB86DRAFT_2805141, partial [Lactarius hatsudake]